MLRLSSVALAAVILTAGGASAATLSFNFRDASSNVFTSGGVTLTATGHRLNNNNTIGAQESLGLWDNGLGVRSSWNDAHLVDGSGANEAVRFAFSQTVRILSVTLAYADRNDTFSFGYQGGSGYVHVTSAQSLTTGSTTWNYAANPDEARHTFNSAYWSSIFAIGAIDGDSEFKIAAMTVETAPSVVPLPAAGWALIAGLGALAAVKRRKSAA
jgi:hypothetical protein